MIYGLDLDEQTAALLRNLFDGDPVTRSLIGVAIANGISTEHALVLALAQHVQVNRQLMDRIEATSGRRPVIDFKASAEER